jgi:hypothetical protein
MPIGRTSREPIVESSRKRRRIADDRNQRILERLTAGGSYAAVAAEFGLTRQWVHQIALRFGIVEERRALRAALRPGGDFRRRYTAEQRAAADVRTSQAVADVASGTPVWQAAIKHRVPYTKVLSAMAAAGVRAPVNRRQQRCTDEQVAKVLDLVAKGELDDDEIAWDTGVSCLTVRGLRRRYPFMLRAR